MMDSILFNSVTVENAFRSLVGYYITQTIQESKKRKVFRMGLVVQFEPSDATWIASDEQGEFFEFTFDDFVTNTIFVHV